MTKNPSEPESFDRRHAKGAFVVGMIDLGATVLGALAFGYSPIDTLLLKVDAAGIFVIVGYVCLGIGVALLFVRPKLGGCGVSRKVASPRRRPSLQPFLRTTLLIRTFSISPEARSQIQSWLARSDFKGHIPTITWMGDARGDNWTWEVGTYLKSSLKSEHGFLELDGLSFYVDPQFHSRLEGGRLTFEGGEFFVRWVDGTHKET